MSDDPIRMRVEEMKRAMGGLQASVLVGIIIVAFGLGTKNLQPTDQFTPEERKKHVAKYDNGNESDDAVFDAKNLEWYRDRFGLDDLEHAKAFREHVETMFDGILEKLARSEQDMGVKTEDNRLVTALMDAISRESKKAQGKRVKS